MKFKVVLFVFMVLGCFGFFGFAHAQNGATLFLSPASGSFFVGSTFSVSVFISTGNNYISSIEANLSFPPDKLQVVSPTTGKSIFSSWDSQPEFSNSEGKLRLEGSLSLNGIKTTEGLVATIVFRVKRSGNATIRIKESSRVFKEDSETGEHSEILNSLIGSQYVFLDPPPGGSEIFSSTHPDNNLWYNNPNLSFSWPESECEGEVGFSFDLDNSPYTIPDDMQDSLKTVQGYERVGDGIWYFHLKPIDIACGGISHFPVFIDTTPPEDFDLSFDVKRILETQHGVVTFATIDNASGVDHFELKTQKIDGSTQRSSASIFFEATSPYKLPLLKKGEYNVTVRVYDNAGNYLDESENLYVAGTSFWQRLIYIYLYSKWGVMCLVAVVLFILIMIIKRAKIMNLVKYTRALGRTEERVEGIFEDLQQELLEDVEDLGLNETNQNELGKKKEELRKKILRDVDESEKKLREDLRNPQ